MLDTQTLHVCPKIANLPAHAEYIHRSDIVCLARALRSSPRWVSDHYGACPQLLKGQLELRVNVGSAHECNGGVAVQVHPEERHEGEKMSDVHRGRGWVYADVCSNWLLREEPVELFSAARKYS